jgi:hypothetical protein
MSFFQKVEEPLSREGSGQLLTMMTFVIVDFCS